MPDDDGWPLERGERLHWQGSPGPGRHLSPPALAIGLAGAVSLAMVAGLAGMSGGDLAFLAAGAVELATGAALVGGMLAWGPWLRRNRRYALTDRRAMVATCLPGMGVRLVSLPLRDIDGIEILPGDPGSLRLVPRLPDPGPVLFSGIPDAAGVEALVRQLRQEVR